MYCTESVILKAYEGFCCQGKRFFKCVFKQMHIDGFLLRCRNCISAEGDIGLTRVKYAEWK